MKIFNFYLQISLLVVFSFLLSCQSTSNCGPEIRAAFDLGSGSTKMKVVELNTCTRSVSREIYEEHVKVDYRDALERSPDQNFSAEIKKDGLEKIKKLKMTAESKGAKKFAGLATAAFRQAKNGQAFAKEITNETGIPVQVISQDQEAVFGYQAAQVKYNKPGVRLLVWDIGGGSQQMTVLNNQGEPMIYYGKLAAVSFKNRVIKEVQNKNIEKVSSPNPMAKAHVDRALALAKKEADTSVPTVIRDQIENSADLKVIGIGGVLSRSLPRQITGQQISVEEISKAIDKKRRLTDKQLNDPFANTDVTNMVLVKAFMQSLGLRFYEPLEVSLMDGLWFEKSAWQH